MNDTYIYQVPKFTFVETIRSSLQSQTSHKITIPYKSGAYYGNFRVLGLDHQLNYLVETIASLMIDDIYMHLNS